MHERIMDQMPQASLPGDGALEQMFAEAAKLQHQAIAQRAHQVFLERGCAHGHDLQDWLAAKRELFDPR
jgi:hypothetical protein